MRTVASKWGGGFFSGDGSWLFCGWKQGLSRDGKSILRDYWPLSHFFQVRFCFIILYIRYWNEPTFWRPFPLGPLVFYFVGLRQILRAVGTKGHPCIPVCWCSFKYSNILGVKNQFWCISEIIHVDHQWINKLVRKWERKHFCNAVKLILNLKFDVG